ncbi:MAG: chromosome partitioning protein ParB, partial [Campylobacterales bacterium]|nr:chromosome partitioning protein ParB [Campylobacterales bacterium]
LQLSQKTQKALVEKKITAGHAKVLVGLDEKQQQLMVNSIIGQKLSVRDVEMMIKNKKETLSPQNKEKKSLVNLNFKALEEKFMHLGPKWKISENRLQLEFSSQDEIDEFLIHFQ